MNAKPVFNRTNAKNKGGLYSVNIRVTIGKKSDYLKIRGFPRLNKNQWDEKNSKVSAEHPFHLKLNRILDQEIHKVDKYYIDELDKGRVVGTREIRNFYENQQERTSFNEFVRLNYRRYCKDNHLEYRTVQVYTTFLNHLDEFNPDIRFYDIDRDLIIAFVHYLSATKELKGSSLKKYIDKLRRMYKEAAKKGLVKYNELFFDKLGIKTEKPERVTLTKKEVKSIRDMDLTDHRHLEQTRDEFLFMCYSGLYYSDLKKLKEENLVQSELGPVIQGKRTKNDNSYFTPIYKFPGAMDIVNKYKVKTKDEYLFPLAISDQKFNAKLKKLAAVAKIEKNLTNKVARHTFTDLMISSGYERAFVSKMLGHKKEATTQEYYEMNVEHFAQSKLGTDVITL